MTHDVVIIGAGPAGLTAAIQLKRFGFEPLVVERRRIGGLALNANLVENYPGFPDGISGQGLVGLFSQQVARLGISVLADEAKQLVMNERSLSIVTNSRMLEARSVIVATGTVRKRLDIPGEAGLRERRIFYEPTDLPQLGRSDRVVVVGGGDAAFDYALRISSQAGSVCLIFRNAKPGALDLLVSRAEQRHNIDLYPNGKVARFEVRNTKLVIETTRKAQENELVSALDPYDPKSVRPLVDDLTSAGFDVIVSIGELEENRIGSNCGYYIMGSEPKTCILSALA